MSPTTGQTKDEKWEQEPEQESARSAPRDPASQPREEHKLAPESAQAVRFNSNVQEIAPEELQASPDVIRADAVLDSSHEPAGPGGRITPADLHALSQSLQGSPLLERRLNIFAFEPVSLPASRIGSHEDSSGDPSRQPTLSSGGQGSPIITPRSPGMHSPPLTPAGTDAAEGEKRHIGHELDKEATERPNIITPQDSTQETSRPASAHKPPHTTLSIDHTPMRPASEDGETSATVDEHGKATFAVGPGDSQPVSREGSPSRPTASNYYSRPFTPGGDANDPYAAHKRQPQGKIEPRFVFSRKKGSPGSSAITLPRSSQEPKRHPSGFFHGKKDQSQNEDNAASIHSRQASMSDLKRFFKMGQQHHHHGHHHHGHRHKAKRVGSPESSIKGGKTSPSSSRSQIQVPFADDHSLTSRYGKLGRVLGTGAGGSVRLMKRAEDNTVFAVKEFRPRHSYETDREYTKKLTAEYCMGSSLHHGNIIETLDIVQEKGKWYEVMEYAPYDLFAIVMTGRMSREEITCCFLQILSGVTYLHSMGLAHRDLKLDNVVVSDRGIMKIIDFGSAHVFKYPFENGIVLASGVVGSDPYLAPEVYEERKYDPQGVDIWSLAIIFCCMTLRRFPWKVPRVTDNSYKLFATEASPGHDPKKLMLPPAHSAADLSNIPERGFVEASMAKPERDKNTEKADPEKEKEKESTEVPTSVPTDLPIPGGYTVPGPASIEKKEVIKGPWRILRLLPRESRHVIAGMLEIDPKKRIKMSEILEDEWVSHTNICRQTAPGRVSNALDHTHVLEPPTPQPS